MPARCARPPGSRRQDRSRRRPRHRRGGAALGAVDGSARLLGRPAASWRSELVAELFIDGAGRFGRSACRHRRSSRRCRGAAGDLGSALFVYPVGARARHGGPRQSGSRRVDRLLYQVVDARLAPGIADPGCRGWSLWPSSWRDGARVARVLAARDRRSTGARPERLWSILGAPLDAGGAIARTTDGLGSAQGWGGDQDAGGVGLEPPLRRTARREPGAAGLPRVAPRRARHRRAPRSDLWTGARAVSPRALSRRRAAPACAAPKRSIWQGSHAST